MKLRALTNGAIAGTQTLTVPSGIVGGVLLSTDNSNAGSVTVRLGDSGGKQILSISSVTTLWITGPFDLEYKGPKTSDIIAWVSVSGTGATAQFYEWVT